MEYKELRKLIERNRSYRRFDESRRIGDQEMKEIIDLVRFTASGRNLQPLKYRYSVSADDCASIYTALKWAGYLADWDGPEEGERPAGYIVQCLDTSLTKDPMCDEGIQLEALTLGAVSKGLGCCIIKSFNKQKIKESFGLPEHLDPRYVVAVGKPVEDVVIEDMRAGDVKYWRDAEQVHHVPKRGLEEILAN